MDYRIMDYRIREVLAAIESDFPRSPNLELLAKAANVSVSRLQHLFKEDLKVSIIQYVKILRLEKARTLLETTNLRIKEIAAAVDYSNVSHFINDFRKAFDFYPKKYRTVFRSIVAAKVNE